MCLIAFQKIFRKIFSGVWKKRRKTQIRKHKPQPRKKKSSTTKMFPVRRPHDRRRNLAKIAILPSRDRTVNRDLGLELELAISDWIFSSCARARALSLSLSFSGNALKEKQKCKSVSVVKGFFFGSTDFNFRKIEFSGPTKQPHFRKSITAKVSKHIENQGTRDYHDSVPL